jgi:uncharacterized protein YjbJ (UPF0337 family)
MGFTDKFRHKAQEMRGRIRRNAGEVTGDPVMRAEGRNEEIRSSLKQAGEKVKDAFRR